MSKEERVPGRAVGLFKELVEEVSGRTVDDHPDSALFMSVLVDVFTTYLDRDQSYGDIWKQYGAMSSLISVARKTDRLMALWWTKEEAPTLSEHKRTALGKESLDDAVDLIAYTVFFFLNARAGNLFGEVPDRPTHPPTPSMRGVKVTCEHGTDISKRCDACLKEAADGH